MNEPELPVWAPRVPQWKIRRLYEDDAAGLHDEDLLDDVGYSLLARCESLIAACAAVNGLARCPRCGAEIGHPGDKEAALTCACGWQARWGQYFSTIQRKQLSAADPVIRQFQDYIARFPAAKTPRAKMLLIDALIHGFHWNLNTNTTTRPAAINLIEGRLTDVIAFLDELSYGGGSTPGLQETKREWDTNVQTARSWLPQRGKNEGA
jgi:hypothetical protein